MLWGDHNNLWNAKLYGCPIQFEQNEQQLLLGLVDTKSLVYALS